MQSYLERYRAGEDVGVWAELVGLGPAVRDEPVYADAQAVAQEMMARAPVSSFPFTSIWPTIGMKSPAWSARCLLPMGSTSG